MGWGWGGVTIQVSTWALLLHQQRWLRTDTIQTGLSGFYPAENSIYRPPTSMASQVRAEWVIGHSPGVGVEGKTGPSLYPQVEARAGLDQPWACPVLSRLEKSRDLWAGRFGLEVGNRQASGLLIPQLHPSHHFLSHGWGSFTLHPRSRGQELWSPGESQSWGVWICPHPLSL